MSIDPKSLDIAPFLLRLLQQPNEASARRLMGALGIGVSSDSVAEGVTNLYFTDERARDAVAASLVQGTNISIVVDDALNTITISSSGGAGIGPAGPVVAFALDPPEPDAPMMIPGPKGDAGVSVPGTTGAQGPAGPALMFLPDTDYGDPVMMPPGAPLPTEGTYTPTLTGVSNTAVFSVPVAWQYMRVGNTTHVSGRLDCTPTAAASTLTQVGFTLPPGCPSAIASSANLTGAGVAGQVPFVPVGVTGDTTNHRGTLQFYAGVTTSVACTFVFTYRNN